MAASVVDLGAKLRRVGTELGRVHTVAAMQAATAAAAAMNVASAAGGVRPGAKIAHVPWPGAQARSIGGEAAAGLSNPAQLVIGNSRTKAHVIGAGRLGTRKRIAKMGDAQSLMVAMGLDAKLGGKKRGKRGKLALSFGGAHPVLAVRHRGSTRKPLWPVIREEGGRAVAPVYAAATRSAVIAAGIGH